MHSCWTTTTLLALCLKHGLRGNNYLSALSSLELTDNAYGPLHVLLTCSFSCISAGFLGACLTCLIYKACNGCNMHKLSADLFCLLRHLSICSACPVSLSL